MSDRKAIDVYTKIYVSGIPPYRIEIYSVLNMTEIGSSKEKKKSIDGDVALSEAMP